MSTLEAVQCWFGRWRDDLPEQARSDLIAILDRRRDEQPDDERVREIARAVIEEFLSAPLGPTTINPVIGL